MVNKNKLEVSDCLNTNLNLESVLCTLCKGIVIEPFKCNKGNKYYGKQCMDQVLGEDIAKDGSKGCVHYNKVVKLGIDEKEVESDVRGRSTKFVFATKEILKLLGSLRFKGGQCEGEGAKDSNHKRQLFSYKTFTVHMARHYNISVGDKPSTIQRGTAGKYEAKNKAKRREEKEKVKNVKVEEGNKKKVKTSKKNIAHDEGDNPFWDNGACSQGLNNVEYEDIKTHIALQGKELEQVCLYGNGLYKRRELVDHYRNGPESFIECPDGEHLLKKGQNMQSHFCRRKEFDIHNNILKLNNLQKSLEDLNAKFIGLNQAKMTLTYKIETFQEEITDRQEEFLMKFEKKELDEILQKVESRFSQLMLVEQQKKLNNDSISQFEDRQNNVLQEHIVSYQDDTIRDVYMYTPREDIYQPDMDKSPIFLTKNSSSVSVWSLNKQTGYGTVHLGDLTRREKQQFVIDTCGIVSSDILIISTRCKKITKLLFFKLPWFEDYELAGEEIVYKMHDALGSLQINGRILIFRDSFYDPLKFYLVLEQDEKCILHIYNIDENVLDEETGKISISCSLTLEHTLQKEVRDIAELPDGAFKHHIVFLFGREYEIHRFPLDEYKQPDFGKLDKVEGNMGILLPPDFIEYYHKVIPLDYELLVFFGTTKLEVRKLNGEKDQNSIEYSDGIICTVDIPAESAIDRDNPIQMESCFNSFIQFHKGRSSLVEWNLNSEQKLDFNNIWDNKSGSSFLGSFYDSGEKQAVMVDMGNNINFIKFAMMKAEI